MEVLNTGVDKYNRLSNKHISRLEIVVLNLVKDNRVNDFDALKKLVFARCRSGTKDGLWSSGRTSGVFFFYVLRFLPTVYNSTTISASALDIFDKT